MASSPQKWHVDYDVKYLWKKEFQPLNDIVYPNVVIITNDDNNAIYIDNDGSKQNGRAEKKKNSNWLWQPSQTSVAAIKKIRHQEELDQTAKADPNRC